MHAIEAASSLFEEGNDRVAGRWSTGRCRRPASKKGVKSPRGMPMYGLRVDPHEPAIAPPKSAPTPRADDSRRAALRFALGPTHLSASPASESAGARRSI